MLNNLICIFCKHSSSKSRSVEHIIPESLGNKEHILQPGIVCDKCNNYFSRKVEGKILNSDRFRIDRHYMSVPSKKNKVPALEGLLFSDSYFPITMWTSKKGMNHINLDLEILKNLKDKKRGKIILPAPESRDIIDYEGKVSDDTIMARFLAKIAIETLAAKVQNSQKDMTSIINDQQFDPLRNFARYGRITKWPFYERRVYPMNFPHKDNEEFYEVLHEYDFLITEDDEWFHVVIIFGIEYTINMGGNEIEGYITWLKQNNNKSPLYMHSTIV